MIYLPYSKQYMKNIITDDIMVDVMNDLNIKDDYNLDDMIALSIMRKLYFN